MERVTGVGGVFLKARALGWPKCAGVPVDERVEVSQYGRFGWATDPEGNRFELWEPVPGL